MLVYRDEVGNNCMLACGGDECAVLKASCVFKFIANYFVVKVTKLTCFQVCQGKSAAHLEGLSPYHSGSVNTYQIQEFHRESGGDCEC